MGVTDTETKDRDQDFLKRAFAFGNAQVESVPDFRLYEDNPDAVTLRLGYFGWDKLQGSNVPTGQEQWLNYLNFIIPIARFTEAVEFYREPLTVNLGDGDIPIDQRPAAGTTISPQLLASIRASYTLRGIYELAGNPDPVYREVPKSLWQQSWFNTGDLRGYNEDVASVVELEVTIRRDNALLAQGFAAYVGLESTVPIMAIP
jgi:YD repeat-containing protein